MTTNTETLNSPESQRRYRSVWNAFDRDLTAAGIQTYVAELRDGGYASATVNLHLAALKHLARQKAPVEELPRIEAIKSIPQRGTRMGTWLSLEQVSALLERHPGDQLLEIRNRALLAMLCGAALRRAELVSLKCSHLQTLDGRLCISDIEGKGRRIRTVPLNSWTAEHLQEWLEAAGIREGMVWRRTYRRVVMEEALSADHVHEIVRAAGRRIGMPKLAPHDLRRTAAALSHKGGAKMQGIQAMLGHQNIQTTSVYLSQVDILKDPAGDYIKL